MQTQLEKERIVLAKGTKFVKLTRVGDIPFVATNEMSVELIQKKMGKIYFRFGNDVYKVLLVILTVLACIIGNKTAIASEKEKSASSVSSQKEEFICEDPESLSPKLKKAYYQLKEAEKELPGMKVTIRCFGNQKQ